MFAKKEGKMSALVGCTIMLSMVYMSLTSWSVAVNELAETFNLSTPMIQAGSALLIAGYAIGGFIQGKWIARWGWKRTFNMVIYPFLIASALIPVVQNYYLILFFRFIQGWGCMVALTCAIISSWFPTKERGLAIGILLGAIGLGAALGGYIGGILTPAIGWQKTFWVITGLTLIGVINFYITVKEAPPLEEELAIKEIKGPINESNLYKDVRLWLLGLSTLCCFFSCYGMYAYLGEYLYTVNYSAQQVGTLVFANGIIAVISTPVGGWISDKLVERKGALKARTWTNTWAALFVGLIGCALMPHLAPVGFSMAILISLVAGWGVPATNGPGLSLPSDLLGSAASGPGVGIVILIAGIGGIVAPILVPYIASISNWTIAWYITAAPCLLGMFINMILGRFKSKEA